MGRDIVNDVIIGGLGTALGGLITMALMVCFGLLGSPDPQPVAAVEPPPPPLPTYGEVAAACWDACWPHPLDKRYHSQGYTSHARDFILDHGCFCDTQVTGVPLVLESMP